MIGLVLGAWMVGCGAPPAPPATAPPPVEAPSAPAFRARTPQERAWDKAAGIDPDKPLPGWKFPEPVTAPAARTCAQGVGGQLQVPDGAPVDLASALPEAGTVPVPIGRHQGERAFDVMTLSGGAAVTAVACTGEERAIDASPPGRWLLVRTPQGWLKLVDLNTDPMKPVLKDVTIVRRR